MFVQPYMGGGFASANAAASSFASGAYAKSFADACAQAFGGGEFSSPDCVCHTAAVSGWDRHAPLQEQLTAARLCLQDLVHSQLH
jgi:hypothetical protein